MPTRDWVVGVVGAVGVWACVVRIPDWARDRESSGTEGEASAASAGGAGGFDGGVGAVMAAGDGGGDDWDRSRELCERLFIITGWCRFACGRRSRSGMLKGERDRCGCGCGCTRGAFENRTFPVRGGLS